MDEEFANSFPYATMPSSMMEFALDAGDAWDFNFSDAPLDFGPPDLDALAADSAFMDALHLDPALAGAAPASTSPAPKSHPALPPSSAARRTRRPPAAKDAHLPRLTTGLSMALSTGSEMLHGQITPPMSTTSSPPTATLDTIDPSVVMPDEQSHGAEPPGPAPAARRAPVPAAVPAAAPPAADPMAPKPKSKRGRKKKILAPAARDAQRVRTLARNRAAAQRCRQRKKVEHRALEEEARQMTRERARLHELVGSLRDELLGLKGTMLRHAGCARVDANVAAYVAEQRASLLVGMPLGPPDFTLLGDDSDGDGDGNGDGDGDGNEMMDAEGSEDDELAFRWGGEDEGDAELDGEGEAEDSGEGSDDDADADAGAGAGAGAGARRRRRQREARA